MLMNSDNDNMMPVMLMMMTMRNTQNNDMLPVLILSMMDKDKDSPTKSKYKLRYKMKDCAEETWKDDFHVSWKFQIFSA